MTKKSEQIAKNGGNVPPAPAAGTPEAKDARIAELEAQLAKANQSSANGVKLLSAVSAALDSIRMNIAKAMGPE